MKAEYKRSIWGIVALIYFVSILIAYFFKINFLLFSLAVPWSFIITILGMLLIHMFSYDLNSYMFVGALLNVVILLKVTVFRFYDKQT